MGDNEVALVLKNNLVSDIFLLELYLCNLY